MSDKTRVVQAGLPTATQGAPFLPGPVFAAPYHAAGDPHSSPFTYGRFHNPTWSQFENALSELEGGATVVFASGMAAIAAVFGTVLRPGDVVVMPRIVTTPLECLRMDTLRKGAFKFAKSPRVVVSRLKFSTGQNYSGLNRRQIQDWRCAISLPHDLPPWSTLAEMNKIF